MSVISEQTVVVSKLSWSLKVLELSASFVGELQGLYLRFLKTWVGLTRLVNPGILFTGCHQRFWNETPSAPYCVEKCQGTKWHILRTSRDACMRELYQNPTLEMSSLESMP